LRSLVRLLRSAVALVLPQQASLAREVHAFLQRAGHINFGLAVTLRKPNPATTQQPVRVEAAPAVVADAPAAAADKAPPAAAGDAAAGGDASGAAAGAAATGDAAAGSAADPSAPNPDPSAPPPRPPPAPVSEEVLRAALSSELAACNLLLVSERSMRKRLEERLNTDLSSAAHKALIREDILAFLSTPAAAAKKEADLAAAAAAEAALAAPFGILEGDKAKTVVVIGAGPAGLSAARHLAANGFVPIVLEARGRVGGRVWTDTASLSVPIDLGASIITGISTDDAKPTRLGRGVRADPSALVIKQLSLHLKIMADKLPLHDAVSGAAVPRSIDAAVEAVRDALMDAARARVDDEVRACGCAFR
jgi:hypothetical protein